MLLRSVPRLFPGLFLCLVGCLAAVLLTGCSSADTSTGTGAGTGSATSTAAASWAEGMETVEEGRLPAEALRTLALIDAGGPFPYAKDGSVFGNFERELPRQERGHYREYTVRTPGERDRGARRIVTGRGGEVYYTDDHYNSFRAVLR
ncbi:ribonuclease domain-containing protein [Streptomyces sp. IB201691-2A2]|uniref:ribonuclease domain-containing protein n=1 Tax=Streptomyces sp. IB201691-2A2 TaxID=2561920 RepID=UPI00117E6281|nr:ribonuclease domain-containing protein [Streptomyces sp. IB201691-2A2]TRO65861.1 ribonuclease N [Streptomyces sp. IB201691-2A2]